MMNTIQEDFEEEEMADSKRISGSRQSIADHPQTFASEKIEKNSTAKINPLQTESHPINRPVNIKTPEGRK